MEAISARNRHRDIFAEKRTDVDILVHCLWNIWPKYQVRNRHKFWCSFAIWTGHVSRARTVERGHSCLGVHVCSIGYLLSFISLWSAGKISDISDFLILRRDTFFHAFIKPVRKFYFSISCTFIISPCLILSISREFIYLIVHPEIKMLLLNVLTVK